MKKLTLRVKSLKELDNKDLTRVVGGRCDSTTGAGSGRLCPCSA